MAVTEDIHVHFFESVNWFLFMGCVMFFILKISFKIRTAQNNYYS